MNARKAILDLIVVVDDEGKESRRPLRRSLRSGCGAIGDKLIYPLNPDPVLQPGMFKDHFMLHLQVLAHARLECSFIHRDGDRDIDVGQADGVEIDPLLV